MAHAQLQEGLAPEVQEALAAAAKRVADEALPRVEGAGDLARRDVAKATSAVAGLERLAGRQTEALDNLSRHVSSNSGTDGSLSKVFTEQAARTEHYVEAVHRELELQLDLVKGATELSDQIEKLVQRIGGTSFAAELLALNALVTAAKLGPAGRAASVLAARMRVLAEEIAQANNALGHVAKDIGFTLPTVSQSAGDLATKATGFSKEVFDTLGRCRASFEHFQSETSQAIAEGADAAVKTREAKGTVWRHLYQHRTAEGAIEDALLSLQSHEQLVRNRHVLEESRIRNWQAEIKGRLEAAVASSVAEIGPATTTLTDLNVRAKSNVNRLSKVVEKLGASTSDESSVGALISTVLDSSQSFVSMIRERCAEQVEVVTRSREDARLVARSLLATRRISMECAMVAIATKIESSRLGQQGTAFAQIGLRMNELTVTIETALEETTEAATRLASSLEQMLTSILEAGALSDRFLAQVGRTRSATDDARRAAETVATESQRWATELEQTTYSAVECLQFQDRMTQELNAIRAMVDSYADTACAILKSEGAHASTLAAAEWDGSRSFLASAVKEEGGLDSGEMMLF